MKNFVSRFALLLVLSFVLVSLPEVRMVKADSDRIQILSDGTPPLKPFPTWIVATITIIAIGGAALLVYFTKVKKTTGKNRITTEFALEACCRLALIEGRKEIARRFKSRVERWK